MSGIIKRDTGKSLEELFDKRYIHEVTIYQLVFMTSGIKDYNNKKLLALQMKYPKHDFTPADYLSKPVYDGKFKHAPGTN